MWPAIKLRRPAAQRIDSGLSFQEHIHCPDCQTFDETDMSRRPHTPKENVVHEAMNMMKDSPLSDYWTDPASSPVAKPRSSDATEYDHSFWSEPTYTSNSAPASPKALGLTTPSTNELQAADYLFSPFGSSNHTLARRTPSPIPPALWSPPKPKFPVQNALFSCINNLEKLISQAQPDEAQTAYIVDRFNSINAYLSASETSRQHADTLFSCINNMEKLILRAQPSDTQMAYIVEQFESINAYLSAPEAQSRQPADDLFDSAIMMAPEDAPEQTLHAQTTQALTNQALPYKIPGQYSLYFKHVDEYIKGVQDNIQQLQNRLQDTKELNNLLLERLEFERSISAERLERLQTERNSAVKLRKTNETQSLNLHLDYSELLFLKLELDTIKSLALPQPEVVATFESAVERFQLNWRSAESRFADRLAQEARPKRLAIRPQSMSEAVEKTWKQAKEEAAAEDKPDQAAAEKKSEEESPKEPSIGFWGAMGYALDAFSEELGWS